MFKFRTFVILALCCAGSVARAETLTVDGWYAANNHDAAMLKSIAIGNFRGNRGGDLAAALERRLADGTDRQGNRYFNIRAGYGSAVDGVFDGQMEVRVQNSNYKTTRKRCAADHSSTSCKDNEKEDIEVKCDRRAMTASVDIRAVRIADDSVIYNRSLPQNLEQNWCPGDSRPKSDDDVVNGFINSVIDAVAGDVMAFGKREKIRIRETRTGLGKDDSAQMKSLILATDKNPKAACAGWSEMESRGVSHPTLGFNLGLCAESTGELDKAMDYYRSVASSSSKPAVDVKEAMDRVQRRIAGDDEANERESKGRQGNP